MKTPDEIKKGLECCSSASCKWDNGCAYMVSNHCATDLKADAIAYIRQLEAENERTMSCYDAALCESADVYAMLPRWIPVEERLPQENGNYLVCYKTIGYKQKLMQVYPYECGFGFWEMTPPSEGFDQVQLEGVTHWMPLPEPPEEVQDD